MSCSQRTEKVRASTAQVKVKRTPKRGFYDRDTIDSILDSCLIGHVGMVSANAEGEQQPIVIPMMIARDGDRVLVHGSSAARVSKTSKKEGVRICLTATVVDGLVLTRSIFHHSMNYRSVVILGDAYEITDEEEKTAALRKFTENMMPGRWADTRPPNPSELKATSVLALPINEASAKIRNAPGSDDKADVESGEWKDTWCGVVPFRTVVDPLIPDVTMPADMVVPQNIKTYEHPGNQEVSFST